MAWPRRRPCWRWEEDSGHTSVINGSNQSPYRPAHLCPNPSRMGMMTLGSTRLKGLLPFLSQVPEGQVPLCLFVRAELSSLRPGLRGARPGSGGVCVEGWVVAGRGIKPRSRNRAYTPCDKVVVVCVGLELRGSLGHLQRETQTVD